MAAADPQSAASDPPNPIDEPVEQQPIGDPPAEAGRPVDYDQVDVEALVRSLPDAAPTTAQREPIDSAPQDGRDVLVYYGNNDETGRVVRWKAGRTFNGRRWVVGGHWVPSDDPAPLPAASPTEWLRFRPAETATDQAA